MLTVHEMHVHDEELGLKQAVCRIQSEDTGSAWDQDAKIK